MPLYEYHCEDCNGDVELLVKNLESRPECPECGSTKMSKMLSVIGSPVMGDGSPHRSGSESETCGKPQCARGCMFGN